MIDCLCYYYLEGKCNASDTTCSWVPKLPWNYYTTEIFTETPYDNAVYFGINEDDNVTSTSYLESPKLTACDAIVLRFYSRISNENISLILMMYRKKVWKKEWSLTFNKENEWNFTELTFNISEKSQDVQFRFVPEKSNDNAKGRYAVDVINVTTYTNCLSDTNTRLLVYTFRQKRPGSSTSYHPFIFVIFIGTFLIIVGSIAVCFLYRLASKRYNHWSKQRRIATNRKVHRTNNNEKTEESVALEGDSSIKAIVTT
ncbi:unnamed protein product [Didymodactylos carnosus]|uniref:MAM domain-containing protein n=1 Tax=Didymodactylos carnosus TaxID=1234261 RepID=A0A814B571_9BILA|nr:unnamed protein product [Didymodactylos carnosus]CAF0922927.1 unnamed protein product [Didymodactylos carnosus]CAF3689424.1 unnamed protein product [Didymodactylos carnosus]CAF3701971.1 unnamed protein product [Didymodactylos carnosus]